MPQGPGDNGELDLKVVIAIGHPSDVHFFRPVIRRLEEAGHRVTVLAREKEVTFYLLRRYGIGFIPVSEHKKSFPGKLADYAARWWRVYRICREIRPDVSVGVGDFILPQAGRLLGFRSVVFTDIEGVFHDAFLTFPFASVVVTPSGFQKDLGKKQKRIDAYKELAYIGADFAPDRSVPDDLGVEADERFAVVRFVSHAAVHDIGYAGIPDEVKVRIVAAFSAHARVFVSSEEPLPKELEKYRPDIDPAKIHSALYYASLVYGESSTMAAEAALAGTPAIFVDRRGRGYTREMERVSGMVFNFSPGPDQVERSIEKGIGILRSGENRAARRLAARKAVADKADIVGAVIAILKGG